MLPEALHVGKRLFTNVTHVVNIIGICSVPMDRPPVIGDTLLLHTGIVARVALELLDLEMNPLNVPGWQFNRKMFG